LNPNNDRVHNYLGLVFASKGDLQGAIREYREALRLNPDNALAHSCLGNALEYKGDRRGALEEYRQAYMLNPKNTSYKQDYERLLRRKSK
jgi:Flp pilus assembly protein TadD